MRVHLGPPPPSPDFDPRLEGWNPLREPTPLMLQIIAAPVAVGLAVALYFGWSMLTPVVASDFSVTISARSTVTPAALTPAEALVRVIGGFFVLILMHELLHAIATPGWGMTPQTLIGVWPSRLLFYAAHLGPLSKNRFIIVFLMPLILLTILPLLACAALQIGNAFVATVSIVNGACACGDVVGAAIILWQVPRAAQVRNQGWKTWWKQE